MEKTQNWVYHLTWHTKGKKKLLIDEVEAHSIKVLNALCLEMKIDLNKIEMTPYTVQLLLGSNTQLNIKKLLKNLQNKLSKSLCKKFLALKGVGLDLWDNLYLIATINKDLSEADLRIEKLVDSLWSVEYYDLDEGATDDLEAFKNYLVSRNLGIIDYGEQVFLVDQKAISKEINLNCFECTKIYKYGCCCGSPCNLSEKNKKRFDKHYAEIADEMKALDEARYKDILANGGFVSEDGIIREHNGYCALLVEHEGVRKCMTHKYALDHQMPIYDLCPLSCLMYPLEILELITDKQKKVILLTSVLEDTFAEAFGRWGSYQSLDVDLRCIDKTAHNEVFKEEDYKPVYKVNKNLLAHEFGAHVYRGIERLFSE